MCNKNYRIDIDRAILINVTNAGGSSPGQIHAQTFRRRHLHADKGAATTVQDEKLIDASEGPVSTVSRADGVSDIVLVCEHAAKRIPEALGDTRA
jgi:hypothetical protein